MDITEKNDNAEFGNFGSFLDITEKMIMPNFAKKWTQHKMGIQ
jgi:hypothetical protein